MNSVVWFTRVRRGRKERWCHGAKPGLATGRRPVPLWERCVLAGNQVLAREFWDSQPVLTEGGIKQGVCHSGILAANCSARLTQVVLNWAFAISISARFRRPP